MNLITKIDGDYKAVGLDIANMDSIDFDDLVGINLSQFIIMIITKKLLLKHPCQLVT